MSRECCEISFEEAVDKTVAIMNDNHNWCMTIKPKYGEVDSMVVFNFLFWMQNTYDGATFDTRPEMAARARDRDAHLLQRDRERDSTGSLYKEAEIGFAYCAKIRQIEKSLPEVHQGALAIHQPELIEFFTKELIRRNKREKLSLNYNDPLVRYLYCRPKTVLWNFD